MIVNVNMPFVHWLARWVCAVCKLFIMTVYVTNCWH